MQLNHDRPYTNSLFTFANATKFWQTLLWKLTTRGISWKLEARIKISVKLLKKKMIKTSLSTHILLKDLFFKTKPSFLRWKRPKNVPSISVSLRRRKTVSCWAFKTAISNDPFSYLSCPWISSIVMKSPCDPLLCTIKPEGRKVLNENVIWFVFVAILLERRS